MLKEDPYDTSESVPTMSPSSVRTNQSRMCNVERRLLRATPTVFLKRCYIYFSSKIVTTFWRSPATICSPLFGIINVNKHEYAEKMIYYYNIWEPSITCFVIDNLAEGDTFIDIGAYIGYYTLIASRIVGPGGKVISVEPSPSIFKKLINNVTINDAQNVVAINVGVADHSHTANFFLCHKSNASRSGVNIDPNDKDFFFEAKIPLEPIGNLVAMNDLRRAKIIKFDVEGAEASVIRSILNTMPFLRDDCIILGEIRLGQRDGRQSSENVELIKRLMGHGFSGVCLQNEYTHEFYIRRNYSNPIPLTLQENRQIDVALCRQPMVLRTFNGVAVRRSKGVISSGF